MRYILIFTLLYSFLLGVVSAQQPPVIEFDITKGCIVAKWVNRNASIPNSAVITLVSTYLKNGHTIVSRTVLANDHGIQKSVSNGDVTITIPITRASGDELPKRVPSALSLEIKGLEVNGATLAEAVLASCNTGLSFALKVEAQNRLSLQVKSKGFRSSPADKNLFGGPPEWGRLSEALDLIRANPGLLQVQYTSVSPAPNPVPIKVQDFTPNQPILFGEMSQYSIILLDNSLQAGAKVKLNLTLNNSLFASGGFLADYPEFQNFSTGDFVPIPPGLSTAQTADHNYSAGAIKYKYNLEIGGSFNSTVVDKIDPITKLKYRERDNLGVTDLFFAPWVNKIFSRPWHYDPAAKKLNLPWEQFITPYTDIAISTGPELKNAQQNRVTFGVEYELRKLEGIQQYDNIHRILIRGVQNSDRDFKDFERNFEVDYKLDLNWLTDRSLFYSLYKREAQLELTPIGVDIGHFSTTRNDFELAELKRPLDKSRYQNRLRFGGQFRWDFLRGERLITSIRVVDAFYIRLGDLFKDNRSKNYFKAEAEFPTIPFGLPDPSRSSVIFFSFERGDKPPFTTPSINSFSAGFRFRFNWNAL